MRGDAMGGRGASSGISKYGNAYGSQYRSVLTVGNIKFVEARGDEAETLVETMTDGRVYVLVNKNKGTLKSIMFFDEQHKRSKRIDLDHFHLKTKPHAHDGYLEGDFRKALTADEVSIVDQVEKIWETYKGKL